MLLKKSALVLCLIAIVLLVLPAAATALTYNFTSGSVSITATTQGPGGVSVLEPGTSPLTVLLGGSFVDFDSGLSANGTITALELVPDADFSIDLDATASGGIDILQITEAILREALGATADVDGADGFQLNTVMSATIAGLGGPPPSQFIQSINSGASGIMGVSGDTLTLAMFGINIATFESITSPGTFIDVKADFSFVGVVPEPTTALLMGLGLAGLAASRRQAI